MPNCVFAGDQSKHYFAIILEVGNNDDDPPMKCQNDIVDQLIGTCEILYGYAIFIWIFLYQNAHLYS